MGREVDRLSARKVQTLKNSGRHADGGGLYLVVDPSGSKRWVMLYRLGGRRREMGLCSLLSVPLATARARAASARQLIEAGVDPIESAKAAAAEAARPKAATFGEVAETFMADREATWRNAAHRRQWRQTLEVQAAMLWSMPVAEIGMEHVLGVLRPIWHTKGETARRLRGRVERILDAARASGLRAADNPARWRGHLDAILPRAGKLTRGHHAAMVSAALPAFYAGLAASTAPAALALRFIILTAARSGEVRGATRGELDLEAAVWTVPAARMKAGREHRVPLTAVVLALLAEARRRAAGRPDGLVFSSVNGRKMSDMVFAMLLRRAGHGDVTTHGFRSTFRDWVDSETDFAGDLAEAALAHLVGDATERAYRRGDALAKRRGLMEAWCAFTTSEVRQKRADAPA